MIPKSSALAIPTTHIHTILPALYHEYVMRLRRVQMVVWANVTVVNAFAVDIYREIPWA